MVEVSMELLALADRVEALTGPDRMLDRDIAIAAIGWPAAAETGSPTPHYTASLDAAMTLLDKVGVLLHLSDIGADGLPLARVGCPSLDDVPIFVEIASCIMTETAPCAGLAMALTAAALRARASLLDSPHTKGERA